MTCIRCVTPSTCSWNGCSPRTWPSENPPMAQSVAERQRTFKAGMKAAGYVKLEAWVTLEQREKFRQIGGDEWLRERINRAKPSDKRDLQSEKDL